MRLNKFIANSGVASRRKADELILAGKIKVNGQTVKELGTQIDENIDKVEFNGKILEIVQENIYIALNKPIGYISSTTSRQGKSILELVDSKEKLYPVGRLDKDSRGLIILTNDGDLAYQLTQAKFQHEKEYEVEIDKLLKQQDKKALEKGMIIDEKTVRGVGVKILSENKISLVLKEGINRQIRKTMAKLGYNVLDLKRIRISKLKLSDLKLKEGEWIKVKKSDII